MGPRLCRFPPAVTCAWLSSFPCLYPAQILFFAQLPVLALPTQNRPLTVEQKAELFDLVLPLGDLGATGSVGLYLQVAILLNHVVTGTHGYFFVYVCMCVCMCVQAS